MKVEQNKIEKRTKLNEEVADLSWTCLRRKQESESEGER